MRADKNFLRVNLHKTNIKKDSLSTLSLKLKLNNSIQIVNYFSKDCNIIEKSYFFEIDYSKPNEILEIYVMTKKLFLLENEIGSLQININSNTVFDSNSWYSVYDNDKEELLLQILISFSSDIKQKSKLLSSNYNTDANEVNANTFKNDISCDRILLSSNKPSYRGLLNNTYTQSNTNIRTTVNEEEKNSKNNTINLNQSNQSSYNIIENMTMSMPSSFKKLQDFNNLSTLFDSTNFPTSLSQNNFFTDNVINDNMSLNFTQINDFSIEILRKLRKKYLQIRQEKEILDKAYHNVSKNKEIIRQKELLILKDKDVYENLLSIKENKSNLIKKEETKLAEWSKELCFEKALLKFENNIYQYENNLMIKINKAIVDAQLKRSEDNEVLLIKDSYFGDENISEESSFKEDRKTSILTLDSKKINKKQLTIETENKSKLTKCESKSISPKNIKISLYNKNEQLKSKEDKHDKHINSVSNKLVSSTNVTQPIKNISICLVNNQNSSTKLKKTSNNTNVAKTIGNTPIVNDLNNKSYSLNKLGITSKQKKTDVSSPKNQLKKDDLRKESLSKLNNGNISSLLLKSSNIGKSLTASKLELKENTNKLVKSSFNVVNAMPKNTTTKKESNKDINKLKITKTTTVKPIIASKMTKGSK